MNAEIKCYQYININISLVSVSKFKGIYFLEILTLTLIQQSAIISTIEELISEKY